VSWARLHFGFGYNFSREGVRVHCSKCGTENAADARFCNQCASPLNRACSKCTHLNAPDAKFMEVSAGNGSVGTRFNR
jgi:predicted amidophosphoribosyltransferase